MRVDLERDGGERDRERERRRSFIPDRPSEMSTRCSVTLTRFLLQRLPAAVELSPAAAARFIHPDIQPYRYMLQKDFSTFKVSNIKFGSFTSTQIRWASHAAAARSASGDSKISIGPKSKEIKKDAKENEIVYHGPISSTIKKVKLLSLSTCCLSVSLGPVITFMTSPDMNVIIKGVVASTVIFLSASTTAALHWFVSPYIHKLKWQPGSDTFDVEMMSWLASPLARKIKFSDVRVAETNRPFVTFKANDTFYFVDADHCPNKALLAKLTPEKLPSAFKNL